MSKLVGNKPSQVPTNADLGTLAYQDKDDYIKAYGDISLNGDTSITGDVDIASGKKLGIGTSSPDAKLHINGSANSEQVIITGNGNLHRGLSIQTAASGGQQDAGVVLDAQDTEAGANPYIQNKLAGANYSKLSGTGVEIYHDIFSDSGSSRGAGYFRFRTDGSSADQAVAQIYMEQGSGDGGARKCNMYLQVSDNGAPTTALTISNNGQVSGNLNDTSDAALKENIADLGTATAALKQLRPRTYDWIQESKGTEVPGFIAQEVAAVIPNAVVGSDYEAPTYYVEGDDIPSGKEVGDMKTAGNTGKAINTSALLAYAVKTIQELEARITELENA